MKNIVLFFLFITSFSFAQSSYIVDKKGNKSLVRDDQTEVLLIDKRISYVNVGKSWEKYIKFENLDYAFLGLSYLKSFHLNQKKKAKVYFVFAEKEDKKLIGVAITMVSTTATGSIVSTKSFYELYVIDNNETVLDQIEVTSGRSKENVDLRATIAPMVRKHFSDCAEVMSKLQKYDVADEENRTILSFISDTEYIECK
ncbi:MAG: hypothetical protein EOO92_08210 [Pedobacter sp.]|nr:MAG: hypothetical protein EOO92_08210 [Pedobacter sp.]